MSANTENKDLREACSKGDLAEVKRLLGKGADVKSRDSSGNTPLHMVDEGQFEEIIDLLVKKGADISKGDRNMWTALHWASVKGKNDVVKCLIKHGANVNAKTVDGFTPLMAAINGFYNKVGNYANEGSEHIFKDVCLAIASHMTKADMVNIKNNEGFNVLDFDNALNNSFVLSMLEIILK
ncbi:ankyrin repeat domain-containing protein 6-like [Tetranychus urticae]|uniref:ankyrin repeat domain-containing protein 6-like n=1 Tax=Tetranychus urticae TaxID=32264 RepID=UPI00077BB7A2|nr:ankyrin repeat domain-containing protein 6-like [Tetranychus urticae]